MAKTGRPIDVGIDIQLHAEEITWEDVNVKEVGKELEEKLKPMQTYIKNMFGYVDTSKFNKSMSNAFSSMQKSYNALGTAQAKYNSIVEKGAKAEEEYQKAVRKANDEIAEAEKEYSNIEATFMADDAFRHANERMLEGTPYKKLTKEEQAAYDKYNEQMDTGYDRMQKRIAAAQAKMPNESKFATASNPEVQRKLAAAYKEVGAKAVGAANAEQKFTRESRKASSASEHLKNAMKKIQKVAKVVKKVFSGLKTVAKPVVTVYKTLAKVISGALVNGFKRLTKHSTSSGKSMTKLWKNIMQFGLGFRSLFFLIKSLRNTFVDQFKEMAKQVPEVNTQISAFMTATNQLKGSLATAFQPIVSAVIPILVQLIAKLTEAMNVIGKFFAVLTGAGKIFKFTATQVDYATESMESGSGAADEYKNQLMGFDEINKLDDNSSSGGGSSDSADGVWTEEPIAATNTLAELIKEGWAKTDFTEVGLYIGEKLKGAFEYATTYLTEQVGPFLEKIVTCLVTGINGLNATPQLGFAFGQMLATALNLAMDSVSLFTRKLDWKALRTQLVGALTGFFDTLDQTDIFGRNFWTKLGTAIQDTAPEFIDSVLTFLETGLPRLWEGLKEMAAEIDITTWVDEGRLIDDIGAILETGAEAISDFINEHDWEKIGQDIGQKLSDIDWKKIFQALGDVIGALADALSGFIKRFDWYGLAVDLIDGLGEGAKKALILIKDIAEALVEFLVGAIRDLLGIASPSKVMEEIGGYVTEGFADGLQNNLDGVKSFIDKIKSIFNDLVEFFNGSFSSSWSNAWSGIVSGFNSIWSRIVEVAKTPINSAISLINGFLARVESVLNGMASSINSLSFTIPSWVPKYGGASIGFNMPYTSLGRIPALAQGAVIPPNSEFLAVLGDQKSGTNIEAPLETIQQAVADVINNGALLNAIYAMSNAVVSSIEKKDTDITLDGMSLARKMYQYNNRASNEHGKSLVNFG